MRIPDNRKLAVLILMGLSLSVMGLTSTAAPGNTIDITGLRITPDPGYSCENTTISFNVTNNMGQMVDLVTVSVAAKGSAGGASWQSNITLFADGTVSAQSFVWTYPPEGTYDVSITVMGAGQISQKSGVYSVLPCAAHVYIGSVTIVKSTQAPKDNATVTVDVGNDGHAPAYNTTVAVQATGPYPDTTGYFIGSTVIPFIDTGQASHPDLIWTPNPMPGVYNVTAMAIDERGVAIAYQDSVVVDLRPHPNVVQIMGISVDPYPPMQGQEGNVTADLIFHGNWSGVDVAVKAYADGQSSYFLRNITLYNVQVESMVTVKFPWLADIEPGEYNLSVSVFGFNPQDVTTASKIVREMARQKAWLPSNFRLDITGLRMSPYPPIPGQNATIAVEIQNTGDTDAPPANLTVTAEGPAFYDLGTRTTPSTSFGSVVRMDFNWTQPILPGEYVVRAFLVDAGGNQSELQKSFPVPHVLESNPPIVNGTAIYNYYYYGTSPNGTSSQNITVIVPAKLNETEASTGLASPVVAGAAGVAFGALVSIVSVLAYGLAKRKGQMGNAQSNPMYVDKGMTGENPLYTKDERKVHGIHHGPENNPPAMAITEQGTPKKPPKGREQDGGPSEGASTTDLADREISHRASTTGTTGRESSAPSVSEISHRASKTDRMGRPAVNTALDHAYARESPTLAVAGPAHMASSDGSTNQWPSVARESPSLPPRGQTAVRESPSKPSMGQTSIRASPTLSSHGDETPKEAVGGTPGQGVPPDVGTDQSNPIPGIGIVVKHNPKPSGNRETGAGNVPGGGSGGDGTSGYLSKKGYDHYKAQSQMNAAGIRANTGGGLSGGEPMGIRESPSKASLGKTSLRESPTLPSRDQATGQATGKRFGIGDTAPEAPPGSSDFAIKENGVKAPQGGANDTSENMMKEESGKKDFKGHVTLLK